MSHEGRFCLTHRDAGTVPGYKGRFRDAGDGSGMQGTVMTVLFIKRGTHMKYLDAEWFFLSH